MSDLARARPGSSAPRGALDPGRDAWSERDRLVLLHDADVRRAVLGFTGRAFHFRTKRGARGIVLAAALTALLAAGWAASIGGTPGWIGAAGAIALALWCAVALWRSGRAAASAFVAADAEHLFVGDERRAWRIAWSLIEPEALQRALDRARRPGSRGALELTIAGQSISVPLDAPLWGAEDLRGLLSLFLARLPAPDRTS